MEQTTETIDDLLELLNYRLEKLFEVSNCQLPTYVSTLAFLVAKHDLADVLGNPDYLTFLKTFSAVSILWG